MSQTNHLIRRDRLLGGKYSLGPVIGSGGVATVYRATHIWTEREVAVKVVDPNLPHFERLREGVDDYRRLLTLARLADEQPSSPESAAAKQLIRDRMSAFRLGQRDHDALFGGEDWADFRRQLNQAIHRLRN